MLDQKAYNLSKWIGSGKPNICGRFKLAWREQFKGLFHVTSTCQSSAKGLANDLSALLSLDSQAIELPSQVIMFAYSLDCQKKKSQTASATTIIK